MSTLAWLGLSAACAVLAFVVLGMRVLHPHHRRLAFAVWILGWIPLGVSALQHRAELAEGEAMIHGALSGHWVHVVLVLALLAVGYLVRVLFPVEPAVAQELDAAELTERVGADLAQLVYLFDKVDEVTAALTRSGLLSRRGPALTADDDEALRALWTRFVEAGYELDVLQAEYRGFPSVNPVTQTALHARCFLVAYGAYVCEYRASVAMTIAVGDNETARTVLNEANEEVPRDSYLALLKRTAHPDTLLRLNAGRAYLRLHAGRLTDEDALGRTKAYLEDIEGWVASSPETFVDNPLDYLERRAFDTWFPIQRTVTKGLSAVHLPSRECFVTDRELRELLPRIRPADTLLMRREWHLTNLGIPGYWTHAAIYVGTPEELDDYFADLPELEGARASDHLRAQRPEAYEHLLRQDERGRRVRVLEAVTKGVRLASLEESGLSDSLAVLRPRASKADKLRALLDGLAHLGKPYDFNFDFATDNRIVCSELVYKAYERVDAVSLEPGTVNGRLLLSPNAFCEKLDAEWDGERQLDFVAFLDGTDHGHVHERDAAALRASHRRPKWHILVADAEASDATPGS